MSGLERVNAKSGLVEVLWGSEWRSVCDDYWTYEDANVLCQQLGFLGFGECFPLCHYFTLHYNYYLQLYSLLYQLLFECVKHLFLRQVLNQFAGAPSMRMSPDNTGWMMLSAKEMSPLS